MLSKKIEKELANSYTEGDSATSTLCIYSPGQLSLTKYEAKSDRENNAYLLEIVCKSDLVDYTR